MSGTGAQTHTFYAANHINILCTVSLVYWQRAKDIPRTVPFFLEEDTVRSIEKRAKDLCLSYSTSGLTSLILCLVCIKMGRKALYNTIQYNTIQYNTIQYNTIQYNTIQYNTIRVYCGDTLSYNNGVPSHTEPKSGSVKARQLIYTYSTNTIKLKVNKKTRYGIFYNKY